MTLEEASLLLVTLTAKWMRLVKKKVLSENFTGGLLDCSLFDIFMRVLDSARGRGGVKFPPLLVIPGGKCHT